MPYPNYHACRLEDPDKYDNWGQQEREHKGRAYHVIRGQRKDNDEWEDQSFRYSKKIWSSSEARTHCRDHDGTFEEATSDSESRRMELARIAATPWAMILAYLDTVVDRVRDLNYEAPLLEAAMHDAAEAIEAKSLDVPRASGTVAVVPLYGIIDQRAGFWSDVSTDALAGLLSQLVADKDIGAIVLDIDSPGGVVYGVPELTEHVRKLRHAKPIYAIANSLAASAAYWIGSAADKLFVTPSGQTGSIGVWMSHLDISKLLEQWGMKMTLIFAGKHKIEGNPWEPLTDEARASLQEEVNEYYGMFVDDVARNRNRRAATVRDGFGEGRLVMADKAVELGMADGVATLSELLSAVVPRRAATPRRAEVSKMLAALESTHKSPRLETEFEILAGTVPPNPPGGDGEGVEGEWSKLRLEDFTDKQWGDLSASEQAKIKRYFAWHPDQVETFDDLHLGHHFPPGHSKAGKPSINGVNNAMSRANQVEGIGGDLERVRAHLRSHQPKED